MIGLELETGSAMAGLCRRDRVKRKMRTWPAFVPLPRGCAAATSAVPVRQHVRMIGIRWFDKRTDALLMPFRHCGLGRPVGFTAPDSS
jgi:hypothetical protein